MLKLVSKMLPVAARSSWDYCPLTSSNTLQEELLEKHYDYLQSSSSFKPGLPTQVEMFFWTPLQSIQV